jgi:hypothetical protein
LRLHDAKRIAQYDEVCERIRPRGMGCLAWHRFGLIGILGVPVASLSGRSTVNSVLRASPAPGSGFLAKAEQMQEHRECAPFDRA